MLVVLLKNALLLVVLDGLAILQLQLHANHINIIQCMPCPLFEFLSKHFDLTSI